MAYLDALAEIANNGPSPEDAETLRRLSSIAGSANYQAPLVNPIAGLNKDPLPAPAFKDATDTTPHLYRPGEPVQVPVPARSDTAGRLAAIAQQQSELINTPAHGLRRIFGDAAGVISAIHSHDPAKGVATAESIKSAPYTKAYGDLAAKAAPLEGVLKEEQERTKEAGANYRIANAAQQGADKVAVSETNAAERKRNDDLVNAAKEESRRLLAAKDEELNKHKTNAEKLAADAVKMREHIEQMREKFDELVKEPNAEKRARIMATVRQTLPPYKQEAGDAEVTKLQSITDPQAKADYLKTLPADIQDYARGKLGDSVAPVLPGTVSQMNAAGTAVQTMAGINKARKILDDPNIKTGPISGRVENGILKIGNSTYDMQQLATQLKTLIPATETATLAGGRTTQMLLKAIKEGSGDIHMNKDQLKGALDAIYDFAKARARGQAPPEEKPKYSFGKDDVVDAPALVKK